MGIMDYPDCYDPIVQAEQREDRWERYLVESAEEMEDISL